MTTKAVVSPLSILLRKVKVPPDWISKENQVSMITYRLTKKVNSDIGKIVIDIIIDDWGNGYYDLTIKVYSVIFNIDEIVNKLGIQPSGKIEVLT